MSSKRNGKRSKEGEEDAGAEEGASNNNDAPGGGTEESQTPAGNKRPKLDGGDESGERGAGGGGGTDATKQSNSSAGPGSNNQTPQQQTPLAPYGHPGHPMMAHGFPPMFPYFNPALYMPPQYPHPASFYPPSANFAPPSAGKQNSSNNKGGGGTPSSTTTSPQRDNAAKAGRGDQQQAQSSPSKADDEAEKDDQGESNAKTEGTAASTANNANAQQQQQQQQHPSFRGPFPPQYPMMFPPPHLFHPQFGVPLMGMNPFDPMMMMMRPAHMPSRGISLSLQCDAEQLSDYQILVRQQLELFEAGPEDAESNTQGRKKPVSPGQVGLRCRHCAGLPLRARGRGAVYYPTRLHGIYQAAQNMAASHLCQSCQAIPPGLKEDIQKLRERRDNASGGKAYWAKACEILGVVEGESGLVFRSAATAAENGTPTAAARDGPDPSSGPPAAAGSEPESATKASPRESAEL